MIAPTLSRTRRLIGWIAFVIAALSLAWTVYLVEFGGFDAKIFGIKITTHQPLHTLVVSAAALAILVVASGVRLLGELGAVLAARMDDGIAAAALAVATCAVGLAFCTTAASGSDSYGYVSQADLWLSGHLTIPQPWVAEVPWPSAHGSFVPLGYRPVDEQYAMVPTYSPGLPLLMAAAKLLAGHCAVFWIVPLSGGVLVLATFGLGRRLGSPRAGVIAAWLVATSPAFLYMLMWPMTDVPVAAAWAVAFFFLLGRSVRSSVAAGLAAAAAVLIRPNLVPLAGVLGLWFVLAAWRDGAVERPRRIRQLVGFAAGLAPGLIAVAVINWQLYGSPLQSGYAHASGMFDRANIPANLKNYTWWLIDSQTPVVLAGLAALFVPLKVCWPRVPDRSIFLIVALFVLTIWAEYSAFLVFDAWWYLRFLLPCWPFIMLGLASVALAVARLARRPVVTVVIAAAVVVLGVRGIRVAADRSAFELWMGERRYVTVAKLVRAITDDNSVIVSLQHSGSLRYYAGRTTLRFDWIDDGWLDRGLAWLAARGVHPYLLAEDWELVDFKRRFAGEQAVARLDMPPVFVYSGPATIYFYDLLRPTDAAAPVDMIIESYRDPRCLPPAPPPRLVFKR